MSSSYAFAITLAQPLPAVVETLRAALAAEQLGIVSEVDRQATLKAKRGLARALQRLLGVCSPRVAHALVTAEPDMAALLPCGASGSTSPAVHAALEGARAALLRVVARLGGQGD